MGSHQKGSPQRTGAGLLHDATVQQCCVSPRPQVSHTWSFASDMQRLKGTWHMFCVPFKIFFELTDQLPTLIGSAGANSNKVKSACSVEFCTSLNLLQRGVWLALLSFQYSNCRLRAAPLAAAKSAHVNGFPVAVYCSGCRCARSCIIYRSSK